MSLLEERHPMLRGHHVPEQLHGAAQAQQLLLHLRARLPASFPTRDRAPPYPEQASQLLLRQRPLRRRGQGCPQRSNLLRDLPRGLHPRSLGQIPASGLTDGSLPLYIKQDLLFCGTQGASGCWMDLA